MTSTTCYGGCFSYFFISSFTGSFTTCSQCVSRAQVVAIKLTGYWLLVTVFREEEDRDWFLPGSNWTFFCECQGKITQSAVHKVSVNRKATTESHNWKNGCHAPDFRVYGHFVNQSVSERCWEHVWALYTIANCSRAEKLIPVKSVSDISSCSNRLAVGRLLQK
jgi:hypothetical protein